MAQFVEDKDRKVIPRWRSSSTTAALGELDGVGPARNVDFGTDFEEKLEEWKQAPSPSTAAELVGAGFVHSRLEEVAEAAEYLSRNSASPGLLIDISDRVLVPVSGSPDEPLPREEVRFLRDVLRINLHNPFKWVDLARTYTTLGRFKKAERALQVALQLARNDRFVLRSAVRFYLHIGRPDRAHALLLSSEATASDPWLIGPEIAVAALQDRRPELLKSGTRLLASQQYPDSQLTELAAAIGTHELEHGSVKRGRSLLRQALIAPTENTIAQVRWAAKRLGGVEFDPRYLAVERSFEARAWDSFYRGEWKTSLDQTREWLSDQPFSSRPAALGSFLAAVIVEDQPEAVWLLRQALRANPGDGLLLNNLAYSLAIIGEFDEASRCLAEIRAKAGDGGIATLKLATSGLLEFRRGNFEGGRTLYQRAFEMSRSAKLRDLSTRVALFWAMQEARSGFPLEREVVAAALRSAESSSDPVLRVLCRRVIDSSKRTAPHRKPSVP